MARIVFAAGVPHAPGLIGLLGAAPPAIQTAIGRIYGNLRAQLVAARPDVLIVFANDHLINSYILNYPDFLMGMAERHSGPFEWYKEWLGCDDYSVAGDTATAERLFNGMARRGVRMAASRSNLRFDDNVSVPTLKLRLPETGIRLIPILQNCTVPPFPDTRACYGIGRALARTIEEDFAADMRVALLGSGGLSHEPGGADYWKIDKAFDLWFLELVGSGDHQRLLEQLTVQRMEHAGSGGTVELMAWIIVMGAIGPHPGALSEYVLHTDFKCGIGSVIWDLTREVSTPPAQRQPTPATGDSVFLRTFSPSLVCHDLIQDLKWDRALRARFARDEAGVLDAYPLGRQERGAIERRDFRALYDMGLHPYLGGQLARLIYGNAAGAAANGAVRKLVESLKGRQAEAFAAEQGVSST